MTKFTLFLLLCFGISANAQNAFFSKTNPPTSSVGQIDTERALFFSLDISAFQTLLDELSDQDHLVISLPGVDGRVNDYRIVEASVMEDNFQADFPAIRSFKGQGITKPQETLRFSVTPLGFHALILGTSNGAQLIKPVDVNRNVYAVFSMSDLTIEDTPFECQLIETAGVTENNNPYQTFNADDGTLRNFRMAISATSEYSAFYNNNLTDVISAIVIAVSNANAVLERDLSVTLTMVDNASLIFFDPVTDPFTNFDNGTLLAENQTLIDSVIGNDNYDIGHVFNTAGGGVAGLGTSCITGFKAWGVTGATSSNDLRFLFVFLHELGHQFGSPHTFNSDQAPCFDNISIFTAVEPGSGSTIMAYPGLCGSQNVINTFFGDLYYHQISLDSMWSHLLNSGACPVNQTSTGNTAPVANAGADYLIPQGTPYKLTGNSTDPDGTNSHTYTWEQYDFGSPGAPTETTTTGPLVRSFLGTTNPTRYIPNIPDLLESPGSQTWERLVTVDRAINFRLTVRDNDAAGGQTAVDAMTATVTTQAGPFEVTSQNTPNQIIWSPGTTELITWNVAGTDSNGINETNVNIILSTDEGLTYDTVLAANTPNDGVENIIVPNLDATKCRIMIEAVDNIFFNINEAFFAIGNYTYGDVCEDFVFDQNTVIPENASSYNAIPFQIDDTLEIDDLNVNVSISGVEDNGSITFGYSPPVGGFYELGVYPCPGTSGLNLTFDDEGNSIDCTNLNSGDNVIPVDPLSILDGENAQGNWTFWITDVNENGITSSIDSFTLSICNLGLVPTLSTEEVTFEEFSIYPNPSIDRFKIRVNTTSTEDISIELFDLLGRRVKQNRFAGQASFSQTINTTELSSGIYLVKVNQGQRSATKKLIKK